LEHFFLNVTFFSFDREENNQREQHQREQQQHKRSAARVIRGSQKNASHLPVSILFLVRHE